MINFAAKLRTFYQKSNMSRVFFMFLLLELAYIKSYAQFFTIMPDSGQSTRLADETAYGDSVNIPLVLHSDTIRTEADSLMMAKREENLFPSSKGLPILIEKRVPVFGYVRNNPLLQLLEQRVTVCLPLDYMTVNSRYGYRKDPVYRCERFHDGIDLKCNYGNVYAMMPGIVKEVHRGTRGYGNYVILQHGSIECLYGHLSVIAVNENDVVEAGDIVAISGNTGKSTGPHLHLRLRKGGKSIDPQPFVNYLNDYIDDLQDRIATLKFGGKPDRELNIENLARVLEQYHVKYPKIVIAQSLLETGYYTSRVCWECKNLFGLRRPSDGSYYKFDRWEDSVKAYRDYVQYKYKGGDYLQFLNRIGYAEDKSYVLKVRQIAKTL